MYLRVGVAVMNTFPYKLKYFPFSISQLRLLLCCAAGLTALFSFTAVI
jgi:hypothetical protein